MEIYLLMSSFRYGSTVGILFQTSRTSSRSKSTVRTRSEKPVTACCRGGTADLERRADFAQVSVSPRRNPCHTFHSARHGLRSVGFPRASARAFRFRQTSPVSMNMIRRIGRLSPIPMASVETTYCILPSKNPSICFRRVE